MNTPFQLQKTGMKQTQMCGMICENIKTVYGLLSMTLNLHTNSNQLTDSWSKKLFLVYKYKRGKEGHYGPKRKDKVSFTETA